MSVTPAHWELPGPSSFITCAVERVRAAGIHAIITPPHCPDGLGAALMDKLGIFDLPTIDARSSAPPLQALSQAFEIQLKSARTLALEPQAEGRAALVAGLDAATTPRWETTLRAYLAGCHARPRFGALVIIAAAPDCQSVLRGMGVTCQPWRNAIGFRDALLWALRDQALKDPLLGRLAAETAVSLAGWELEELSRQMYRMRNAKMIFEAPSSNEQAEASWAQGGIDDFDGVPFRRLASASAAEIKRRLWRAQVTVLFGWLEGLRSEFVFQNKNWLDREARSEPNWSAESVRVGMDRSERVARAVGHRGDRRSQWSGGALIVAERRRPGGPRGST